MMKATVIILFLPLCLLAQIHIEIKKYNTDSLQRLIPQRQGTELADIYYKLASTYSFDNPPLCEQYANQALKLSKELDYIRGIADAERLLGQMYWYEGDYPETVIHLYNAMGLYEKMNDNYSLAKLYYDFAKLYFYINDYAKTEEYAQKAMDYYQLKKADGTTTGSFEDIARLRSAHGLLYRFTNQPAKARDIYRWYNKIAVEQGFGINDRMVHTLVFAECFYENREFDSALFYLNKTLEFPEVNSSIGALKMEAVKYKGFVYYDMNNFPEAERCFKQVNMTMDEKGYIRHACESCLMLGKIYSREGKTGLAQEYYLKTFLFSDEMVRRKSYYRHDSLRNTISSGAELNFPWPKVVITRIIWAKHGTIAQILSDFYMERADWQKAYHYQAILTRSRDSLNALVRNRDLIDLQTKYETSRKEQQIEQLSRENRYKDARLYLSRVYLASLGTMLIMLIIIGILLIHQDKIRAQQRTVVLEQKLLRSQMNPHFIFNSMASIQDFIISKDARSAAIYLSRFASLIRNILDASINETIPVRKEIETIEHYLHLQKVRLEEKFDFVITKDEAFEDDRLRIPALLVQPFVENAIEHGIRNKQGKGLVKVEFLLRDHWLSIVVEDDGVGRARAREFAELKKKDHASVSTSLILERLKLLNRKSRNKITLEIRDLYDNAGEAAGTRVEIVVPVGG